MKVSKVVSVLKKHPYISVLSDKELMSVLNFALAEYYKNNKELTFGVIPNGKIGYDGATISNSAIPKLQSPFLEALSNSKYKAVDFDLSESEFLQGFSEEDRKIIYSMAINRAARRKPSLYRIFNDTPGYFSFRKIFPAFFPAVVSSVANEGAIKEEYLTAIPTVEWRSGEEANIVSYIKFEPTIEYSLTTRILSENTLSFEPEITIDNKMFMHVETFAFTPEITFAMGTEVSTETMLEFGTNVIFQYVLAPDDEAETIVASSDLEFEGLVEYSQREATTTPHIEKESIITFPDIKVIFIHINN